MSLVKILGRNYGLDLDKEPFTEIQETAFENELLSFKRTFNDLFVLLRRAGRSLRSRHPQKEKVRGEAAASASPVKDEVQQLMKLIEEAVKELSVDPDSPSARARLLPG